jgi:hypothetical protein
VAEAGGSQTWGQSGLPSKTLSQTKTKQKSSWDPAKPPAKCIIKAPKTKGLKKEEEEKLYE